MAGRAAAVASGDALVKDVAALGRSLGLLAREQFRAGRRIWGAERRIDVILTDRGPLVVEVNPRLTTAYAGLHRALGRNPAALALADGDPEPPPLPTGPGVAVTV